MRQNRWLSSSLDIKYSIVAWTNASLLSIRILELWSITTTKSIYWNENDIETKNDNIIRNLIIYLQIIVIQLTWVAGEWVGLLVAPNLIIPQNFWVALYDNSWYSILLVHCKVESSVVGTAKEKPEEEEEEDKEDTDEMVSSVDLRRRPLSALEDDPVKGWNKGVGCEFENEDEGDNKGKECIPWEG